MKNTIGNKLSFDMDGSKREKTKDSHNSNPSKQQNVNKKKDVKKGDGSKDSSNTNISTTSGTNHQHTLKQSINKAKTREGRRLSQDETKILTFHPKQALWKGERTKLRSYIQQWHT